MRSAARLRLAGRVSHALHELLDLPSKALACGRDALAGDVAPRRRKLRSDGARAILGRATGRPGAVHCAWELDPNAPHQDGRSATVAENGADRDAERAGAQRSPYDGAARRRPWIAWLLGAVVLVAAVGIAWSAWRPFAEEPSATTADARRQLSEVALFADAAAAAIVLADVRADVTGTLRRDEIRTLASGMMARVRRVVEPLPRSEAVSTDEVESNLARLEEALRIGDPSATEALDALLQIVAKVGP